MITHYQNLDGLRVFSCMGIISMHLYILGGYSLGKTAGSVITSWNELVPLFLLISGFGMFCGYYDKVKDGRADWNLFYKKRYQKILPFFAFVILIDLLVERSLSHLIEGVAELTLAFGLLPFNQLDCIGIGWTIGVIFLFYMLFPFFVFLCWSKRRACISFAVSVILSGLCSCYFFADRFVGEGFINRQSFLYCAPYFAGGGLLFVFREEIRRVVSSHRWHALTVCILLTAVWYCVPADWGAFDGMLIKNLAVFLAWLAYAVSVKSGILSNRVTAFLSSVSLEAYLSQMIVIRGLQKARVLQRFGSGWTGYAVSLALVLLGIAALIAFFLTGKKLFVRRFAGRRQA